MYRRGVASYETTLTILRPIEEAFAFVSDFSNAARWDPRTYEAHKATDGPVGIGTRFVLIGGLLREESVRRFRIPRFLAGMALPYDVVDFDAPNKFILEGKTPLVSYRDVLEFSEENAGTRLRYYAELRLRGPLVVAGPLLRRIFQRIGDDATRDLPEVVARGG